MYTRAPQAELGRANLAGASDIFDGLANLFKTGSDVYQAQKGAEVAAQPPIIVPQQTFMQKHGLKLVLVGVGVGAFLWIRSRRKRS
jgi:hypothetical protein